MGRHEGVIATRSLGGEGAFFARQGLADGTGLAVPEVAQGVDSLHLHATTAIGGAGGPVAE